jgi:electron transport complex protein RnfB
MSEEKGKKLTRREVLRYGACGAAFVALGGGAGVLGAVRGSDDDRVWQIDPTKCIQCGNCAINCVLTPSAVKCVHAIKDLCGYCEPCFGYYNRDARSQAEGAENQLCPVGAIERKHVSGPFYEYTIDEEACIGCGKCCKGCRQYGNGSLYLQVRHDRCLNCSQCSIAEACPSEAFVRVPASNPYLRPEVPQPRIPRPDTKG